MTCERARALIDGFVQDELSADDARALADHLRGCAACTAEMASASRLIELLTSLPNVPPTPDFDERVLLASLEDRRRRHEHRNWLADLWTQILRGTVRTTGTFMATVLVVAIIAVGGVWAASNLVPGFAQQVGLVPQPTPRHVAITLATSSPTATPAAKVSTAPHVVMITPKAAATPTPHPTQRPTPAPTPTLTPAPSPTPTATPAPTGIVAGPTSTPKPSPSASPTPTPAPSLTPMPRRCPPGAACSSPSPTPVAASPTSP
jgi:hypothetical protein